MLLNITALCYFISRTMLLRFTALQLLVDTFILYFQRYRINVCMFLPVSTSLHLLAGYLARSSCAAAETVERSLLWLAMAMAESEKAETSVPGYPKCRPPTSA